MITNWIMTNLQLVFLAGVVLAGGIGALTYGREKFTDENGESFKRFKPTRLKRTAIVVGGLSLAALAFPFVPAGYEGVIFDRRPNQGVLEEPRQEGLTFTIPLVQSSININVRKQLYTVDSNVQTLDLQEVLLPVALNYEIEDSPDVYQNVGVNYVDTIIDPAVFQATTVAAGQVTAESIAQSRTELTAQVAEQLTADLAAHGIRVVDVAIKDAVFDKDFILAVKNKVIAEQKAAEAARLIEVARSEAEQVRLRAQGDGDAKVIIGTSERHAIEQVAASLGLTPEQYLEWVSLQKWNGQVPTVILGEGSDTIIPIPTP